jgi:hypothetical protein
MRLADPICEQLSRCGFAYPKTGELQMRGDVRFGDLGSARFDTTTRDKLRLIAKYQRWVLLSLLGNLVVASVFAAQMFGLFTMPDGARWVFRITNLCLCFFMLASIVLLTKQFCNLAVTILCGLAMFLPIVSLVVLLVVNGKATKHLQHHGVKVGLLGADPSGI